MDLRIRLSNRRSSYSFCWLLNSLVRCSVFMCSASQRRGNNSAPYIRGAMLLSGRDGYTWSVISRWWFHVRLYASRCITRRFVVFQYRDAVTLSPRLLSDCGIHTLTQLGKLSTQYLRLAMLHRSMKQSTSLMNVNRSFHIKHLLLQ